MTFKYGLTVPAEGANKLVRFRKWAQEAVPDLAYKLPPQVPVRTERMNVRLRSPADVERLAATFPSKLP